MRTDTCPPPWSRRFHLRNKSGVGKEGSCALSRPVCARTRLKGPEPCPPTTLHFDPQQRNSCICTENSQSGGPRKAPEDRNPSEKSLLTLSPRDEDPSSELPFVAFENTGIGTRG